MNPTTHYECDWLAVFFIHEVAEFKDQSDAIIDQILKAGANDTTAVYLIMDSVQQVARPVEPPDPARPGATHPVNYFTMTVSRLQKDHATGSSNWARLNVPIDNLDKQCWKQGFAYVFSTVKAKRNMMMCFSHGAAFGIDADHDDQVRKGRGPVPEAAAAVAGPRKMNIVSNRYYYLDQKDIAGFLEKEDMQTNYLASGVQVPPIKDPDRTLVKRGLIPKGNRKRVCSKLQILWISQLAATLKECLDKNQIDLLLMNNCYMQSFDTGFLLKDNVEYIIAPEGVLNAVGYDYYRLLNRIAATPEVDNASLAEGVIEDYEQYYNDLQYGDYLAGQAVFAATTARYCEGLGLFGGFLKILQDNWNTVVGALVDIRENHLLYVSAADDAYSSNNPNMIDVFTWVQMVIGRLGGLFGSTSLLGDFQTLKTEIAPYGYVGSRLTGHDADPANTKKYGYSGISIFYPLLADLRQIQLPALCTYFADQVPSDWESTWKCFLAQYYLSGKSSMPAPSATGAAAGPVASSLR